jgi:ribonuclease HI
MQYAAKKGTQFALAISRIANCTQGPTYRHTRMLFTSVAAPRMDYAAIVWYKPLPDGKLPPKRTEMLKLETTQRTAMKAILGTFRTTSTSALQIESSLPPTYLRLRNRVLQSWIRMQTAPESHPVNAAIRRATSSRSQTVITPFEYLAMTFPRHASPLETIKPFPVPPWWSPPFTFEIDVDKESAKARHDATRHDDGTLCIYTDGSGIDGHISASAVCPAISQTRRRYLGPEDEHNVYEAEVTAFELAAEIALNAPPSFTKCVIYPDSQAAILGANSPDRQSGQTALISATQNIQRLIDTRNMTVKLDWVPGHEGIPGNEEADTAAKEAAMSKGQDISIP